MLAAPVLATSPVTTTLSPHLMPTHSAATVFIIGWIGGGAVQHHLAFKVDKAGVVRCACRSSKSSGASTMKSLSSKCKLHVTLV